MAARPPDTASRRIVAHNLSGARERRQSKVTDLFQAGGALLPRSKAFDASIYRRDPGNFAPAQDAMRYLPQVIGSPRLSGKTTQVNTITSYHERLAGQGRIIPLICDMEDLKAPPSDFAGEWQVDEES